MCGLFGYFKPFEKINFIPPKEALDLQSHRGPDFAAYKDLGKLILGHNRLSILDLDVRSNQPFISRDGRYAMVFNGEVYNYKAIAEKYNIEPRTTGDSEIVLELFSLIGEKFVEELIGMFAIAIWDSETETLRLFRDRIGIKPLYYFYHEGDLVFSSELNIITTSLKGKLKVDQTSLFSYLQLGYVPSPGTLFEGVMKLEPGSLLKISENDFAVEKYWSPQNHISSKKIVDESTALKELEELLLDSVEKRLIADVPLGTFLSGGTDSGVVTAIAQSILDKPINTFSIGFKNKKFDESEAARKIATQLKTHHHEEKVNMEDALNIFDALPDIYDDILADTSVFPTYLVSKMAAKHVKVVLSGDGGDELFMGYGTYLWANRLENWKYRLASYPLARAFKYINPRYRRIALLLDAYRTGENKSTQIFSQESYFFSERESLRLIKFSSVFQIREDPNFGDLKRTLDGAERQALYDLNWYMPDDLLNKMDRGSMAHSLEARVPLLDHRLVEFALNIDQSLKFGALGSKHLLKKLLYKYIPKEFYQRPKWGFSVPMHDWLKNELAFTIEKYLSREKVEARGLFHYNIIEKLKNDFEQGEWYLSNRLWSIILLEMHLEKHGI